MSLSQKPTIVVIDDDRSVRRALRLQLRLAGFKVKLFESAEDFLRLWRRGSDAYSLVDVYLPGMNGADLCRHLTATGWKLPAILMSARDDECTRRMMKEAGAAATLFKPFDEKALLSAIRRAVRDKPRSDRRK